MTEQEQEIIQILLSNNQHHLIKIRNTLKNEERIEFDRKIKSINFTLLNSLYKNKERKKTFDKSNISNFNFDQFIEDSSLNFDKFEKEILVSMSKSASLMILCAGQGTRLGYDHPKGCFKFGMPSNKSIFENLCNRVYSLQKEIIQKTGLEKVLFPIVLHTSKENDEETRQFFEENKYFQLDKSQFYYVPNLNYIQSLDYSNGQIILSSENEIYEAPNGNGGALTSLKDSGVMKELLNKGIRYINVISIDNPLIKVLDPEFFYWHIKRNAGFSVKYIEKTDPYEKTGVFVKLDNKPYMIDYGDMPNDIREEKELNDKLSYRTSNILSYILSLDLVDLLMSDEDNINSYTYSYNTSIKKLEVYDSDSDSRKIKEFLKFELFLNTIFEYLPKNQDFLLIKTTREKEFSPIKSKEGADSPETTRKNMSKMFLKWLNDNEISVIDKELNKEITNNDIENNDYLIEIDFKLSYDGKNLKSKINKTHLEIDNNRRLYIEG
jgi:UDP-N-acetylglucosamine pyrophosphorylase